LKVPNEREADIMTEYALMHELHMQPSEIDALDEDRILAYMTLIREQAKEEARAMAAAKSKGRK